MIMSDKIKTIVLALLAGAMAFAAGCTRNNGDIGPLFGLWHLDAMAVDGVADPGYAGNCFWSFQNNILCVSTETDPLAHATDRAWGTWSRRQGAIVLDFSHKAGTGPQQEMYIPPAWLRLPAADGVTLAVVSESGSHMRLVYHSAEGEDITYEFTKY